MDEEKNLREQKLCELFETAHKDPSLKMRLLEDPEKVAHEWKVELGPREIERLKKIGAFMELSNEVRVGKVFQCNPLVDNTSTLWLKKELLDLIKDYILQHKLPPIPPGYPPAPWVFLINPGYIDLFRQIERNLAVEQTQKVAGGANGGTNVELKS